MLFWMTEVAKGVTMCRIASFRRFRQRKGPRRWKKDPGLNPKHSTSNLDTGIEVSTQQSCEYEWSTYQVNDLCRCGMAVVTNGDHIEAVGTAIPLLNDDENLSAQIDKCEKN